MIKVRPSEYSKHKFDGGSKYKVFHFYIKHRRGRRCRRRKLCEEHRRVEFSKFEDFSSKMKEDPRRRKHRRGRCRRRKRRDEHRRVKGF